MNPPPVDEKTYAHYISIDGVRELNEEFIALIVSMTWPIGVIVHSSARATPIGTWVVYLGFATIDEAYRAGMAMPPGIPRRDGGKPRLRPQFGFK